MALVHDRTRTLLERAEALGAHLDADAAARLLAFLDAMLELNRHLNLTAIREQAAAEVLHCLDSLAAALVSTAPAHALDLGSGNGFPGIAVATLYPDAQVTLMERTAKKARALRQLLAATEFPRVSVRHVDAAQAPALHPELRDSFDYVTARAVAAPAAVAELAAPLTAPGGQLVLWLDADAPPPTELGASFELLSMAVYDLPEPAPRQRQLALCRRV